MNPLLRLLIISCFGATLFACGPAADNAKRYELKGKVVAVDAPNHAVTVAHEDVKDLMPGMTMSFKVRDDRWFQILAPGNDIVATLAVDGPDFWLEDLVVTQASPDSSAPKTEGGVEPKAGDEVPDFHLLNQDGKPIRIHDYRGKALLLTFVYTRCPEPDQCPLMSENFAKIARELEKQPGVSATTHLLTITFDPKHDKPAVMRSYGAAHTGRYSDEKFEHWEFATGNEDQVKELAQYFGLRYFPEAGQIIHSLRTAIITPEGKVHKIYRGNDWQPEAVLSELTKLVER